jgi:hypothetical protein
MHSGALFYYCTVVQTIRAFYDNLKLLTSRGMRMERPRTDYRTA